MNLGELGEFGLIERWRGLLGQRAGVRLGIGDDAAVLDALEVPVVTCDGLIEKVHFRLDWTSPRLLGRKAITVNVSDIAAMGGYPVAAFITFAPTTDLNTDFADELYAGLEAAASQYGLTIAGGDTVRSPSALMLNVTVIGNAPQPILRSGARAGDLILVTGTLGDSAAGLALLQQPDAPVAEHTRDYLLLRHHDPTARLAEMQSVINLVGDAAGAVPFPVTAAIDLSDGISGDAAHIAARSDVSIELEMARLPVSAPCREAAQALNGNALEWALRGGEDYELLLCVDPEAAVSVAEAIMRGTGTPVTAIGRCIPRQEEAVIVVGPDGKRERAGRAFSHF